MSSATPAPTPAAMAAAATGAATTPGALAVPAQALPVAPGQALAARVLAIQAGMVELALAGGVVTAASDLPLEPGQTLRLVVAEAGPERITLRIAPGAAAPAPAGAPATLPGALAAAGVPASAGTALLAALAEREMESPTGSAATALAARAAWAGVSTPAQAAAFVRLVAAGLPATPASVSGLAQLLDGAPLGRALAGLLDATAARPGGALGAAAAPWPGSAPGAPPAAAAWPLAAPPAAPAGPPGPFAPATATAAAAPLAPLVAALADRIDGVAAGAVQGHPDALRQAIARLGTGLEHDLVRGRVPDEPPARALLLALAGHPAAEPALARAAAALADAVGAQPLAGAAVPVAAGPDPAASGAAYLQLPLPGGGTAEIRVAPEEGRDGDGAGRPRRLAFLLHLSALGPVMVEAAAGPGGVNATVRAADEAARRFLDRWAPELADALGRTAPRARVSVERLGGPPPERLLAPPPSSGLDVSA